MAVTVNERIQTGHEQAFVLWRNVKITNIKGEGKSNLSTSYSSSLSLYSDGEEVALQDNINDIFYMLRYEADLLFTRSVRVCVCVFICKSKSIPSGLCEKLNCICLSL